jgi:hypothetical protein
VPGTSSAGLPVSMIPGAARGHDLRIGDLDHGAGIAWQGVGASGEEPPERRHLHIRLAQGTIREQRDCGVVIHWRGGSRSGAARRSLETFAGAQLAREHARVARGYPVPPFQHRIERAVQPDRHAIGAARPARELECGHRDDEGRLRYPTRLAAMDAERQNLTMRMQMRRFYAVDQRVLEEIREPHAHGCALHRLVQRWRRVLARRFGSLPALPR